MLGQLLHITFIRISDAIYYMPYLYHLQSVIVGVQHHYELHCPHYSFDYYMIISIGRVLHILLKMGNFFFLKIFGYLALL